MSKHGSMRPPPATVRAYALAACLGASAALASWTASCGGEAIIDGSGGGSSSSSGDGSPVCYTPPPVGTLGDCASSGGSGECEFRVCDDVGHQWLSDCDDNSCNCYYDHELRCTCLSEGSTSSCATCCPSPFPP